MEGRCKKLICKTILKNHYFFPLSSIQSEQILGMRGKGFNFLKMVKCTFIPVIQKADKIVKNCCIDDNLCTHPWWSQQILTPLVWCGSRIAYLLQALQEILCRQHMIYSLGEIHPQQSLGENVSP